MTYPITFTLDLEDHRPSDAAELRYPAAARQVLEFLDERNITGTFFVVGAVAEAQPDLVREIAAAGHELALHGWRHVPLTDLDPATFRAETAKGKALLEDLTGQEVVGYRAPTFSLTPRTVWAVAELPDLGFTYSSSVLAARNPLHGYPGAPSVPFVWPTDLAEFPAPLAGVGPWRVPYLGGTYLRLLPLVLIMTARRGDRACRVPWIYLHPYDIDRGEPYWRVPDAGRLSPLLWVGRRGVFSKLDPLLMHGAGLPLRDRIDEARRGGTFRPAVAEVGR